MNEQFKGDNIYSLSLNSHVIEKVSNGVVMMQPTMKTFMSYTVILFKIHSVQNNNSYRALKRILAFRNGETIDQNLRHLLPHIFLSSYGHESLRKGDSLLVAYMCTCKNALNLCAAQCEQQAFMAIQT